MDFIDNLLGENSEKIKPTEIKEYELTGSVLVQALKLKGKFKLMFLDNDKKQLTIKTELK